MTVILFIPTASSKTCTMKGSLPFKATLWEVGRGQRLSKGLHRRSSSPNQTQEARGMDEGSGGHAEEDLVEQVIDFERRRNRRVGVAAEARRHLTLLFPHLTASHS
jgi:hypothetical protein